MELKRRIALATMLIAIGLGSGHITQSLSGTAAPNKVAKANSAEPAPKKIQKLAAETEAAPKVTAPLAPTTKPSLPQQAMTTNPQLPAVPLTPPAKLPDAQTKAPQATPAPALQTAETCTTTLDLTAEPNAMVGLTLTAPCHKDERIVLRHGGLTVTGKTTATGALFTTLPAMETAAAVSVLFKDGKTVENTVLVPELASLRRFGVQWQADDAFQIHAFENQADYGMPGHVSAADPATPPVGIPAKGGFLTLLGNDAVDLPMLAEVYTFPMTDAEKVEVVVEATVTPKTCARELLGETLTSVAGEVFITDLTVATPECDAVGDILVLKNLVPDLKLAAAN